MIHHIVLSVDSDRINMVLDGLGVKLAELGLEMLQTQQNGMTLVSIAAVGGEDVPAEQPAEDPVQLPPEAAEIPAPESTPSTPEVEVELPMELPVKFESKCRVLDISTTEEFTAGTTGEVSRLFVSGVDTSTPGVVSFNHAGTSYRFPTTEEGCIVASVDANGKRKRIKLQVVQADEQQKLPDGILIPTGTVLFGVNDAELDALYAGQ